MHKLIFHNPFGVLLAYITIFCTITYRKVNRMRKDIIEKLLKEKRILTALDIKKILGIDRDNTLYKTLERLTKQGILKRIAKGVYCSLLYEPEKFEIANVLYQPSYISFESALNFYGILVQTPFIITSATVKRTHFVETPYGEFQYIHLSKERFFGYEKIENFVIATPEKSLIDELYLVSKGLRKISPEELELSTIRIQLLKKYAEKMRYKPLWKILRKIGVKND